MSFKRTHYFWQCYHCSAWTYSDRRIKRRKCLKCGRFITFDKVKKTELNINPTEAPTILKYLKLYGKFPIKDDKN